MNQQWISPEREKEVERLLSFLYRVPVGLAECDLDGTPRLLNAVGAQILGLLGPAAALEPIVALAAHDPELPEILRAQTMPGGVLCHERRIRIARSPQDPAPVLIIQLSALRLDAGTLMLVLCDATRAVVTEAEARRAAQAEAVQATRADIAADILHDIGNAMTSLGTTIATLLGEPHWPELKQLGLLGELMRTEREVFARALGERRGATLTSFIDSLEKALQARRAELMQNMQRQAQAIAHVQDILMIQRQMLREPGMQRSRFALTGLVRDALALAQGALTRRGCTVHLKVPGELPPVAGDRTQLLRVMLNLIKNAAESFDELPASGDRRVDIELDLANTGASDEMQLVRVRDSGAGFDDSIAARLFEHGFSTKKNGAGLGLDSSKRIVESHGGALEVRSPGPGAGAEAVLQLPTSQRCLS